MPGASLTAPSAQIPGLRWVSDAAWAAAANISQAAGPFVGIWVLTHWYGLGQAGQFALAQATSLPIVQLLSLQLKPLLLTHTPEALPLSHAFSLRLATIPLTILISIAVGLWMGPAVAFWLLARLVESWAEVYQAENQRRGNMPRAALSTILRSLLLVGSVAWWGAGVEAAVTMMFGSLLLLSGFDARGSEDALRLNPVPRSWSEALSIWRPLLNQGLSLGGMMFLQAFSASMPRIALERSENVESLGLFAVLAVVPQAGNLLSSSLGQAILPSLPSASLRTMLRFIAMPAAAALVALPALHFGAPLVLTILGLPQSPTTLATLDMLAVAQIAIWPSAVVGYGLTARRIYRPQVFLGLLLVVTSLVGSALLIPAHGPVGAAAVLGLTALTLLLASLWLLRQSGDSR